MRDFSHIDPRAWVTGRPVTVLGAARSGLAAAGLLQRAGANVFVSDIAELGDNAVQTLKQLDVEWEDGGHTDRALEADLIVASPGVPDAAPPMRRAIKSGIPIVSEIEAASWFCGASIVAITGSNGKTTTTELLGHIFREDGRSVAVCGNVGRPFSDIADSQPPRDVVVLEVSSFQLDHVRRFRPRVAVILNISADHLDRYDGDIGAYAAAKWNITSAQTEDDALILNLDDERLKSFANRAAGGSVSGPPSSRPSAARNAQPSRARVYGITLDNRHESAGRLQGDSLILQTDHEEEVLMKLDDLALRGRHNVYNSLAAAVAARVMEVRSDVVRESLKSFEGVPHRLETVRESGGVRWVNDSKATNVNAVWYALESFSSPVVLIMGGRDKGNDYDSLKPLISSRVKALISIGESAETIDRELGPSVEDNVIADSLEDAVKLASLLARDGDVVLLSPACSSFDAFDNFEQRGEAFRRLVNML